MRTKENVVIENRGTVAGRARRAQIERAAIEVLSEVGYAAASVGLIAKRVGVSKGVVTYHFTSKDEILRRVALVLFEDCAAHIAASVCADMSPEVRLRALLTAELEFFSSRRLEFRAMVEVISNYRDPGFIQAFESVSMEEVETLADLLRQGQAQGKFRSFDAKEVAHLINTAKNAVLDRWASEATLELVSMTTTLLDFVEHGVRI